MDFWVILKEQNIMYNPHEDIYNEVNWKNLFTPPKKEKKEVSQQEKHFYTNRKDNNHSNYHSIKAEESFDTFFALCYSKWIHTVQHCHFCFRRESKIWNKKKSSFRARDQHTRELMLLLFWPAFNLLPSFSYFYFFFFPHHSRKLKLLSLKRGTRTYKSKRHVYMKKTRLLCCSN